MPIGRQDWQPTHGGHVPGMVVPVPPQALAPAPPSLSERQAGAEAFKHVTLDNTAGVWPGGVAEVDFSTESNQGMRMLAIYAGPGDVLYIALDNSAVGTGAGSYDLYHPGKGMLVMPVPFTKRLYLATFTAVPPLARVEVTGLAGSFTL